LRARRLPGATRRLPRGAARHRRHARTGHRELLRPAVAVAQEPPAVDRPVDAPPRDPQRRTAAAGGHRGAAAHGHHASAQSAGAAPSFRTLPYWESFEPFPLPSEEGIEPDPRAARMDIAVTVMNTLMPHFALMHEMTTEHVHEEIQ